MLNLAISLSLQINTKSKIIFSEHQCMMTDFWAVKVV